MSECRQDMINRGDKLIPRSCLRCGLGPCKKSREVSEETMKLLVDRFLSWELPASVAADQCATQPGILRDRLGTNLLSASEARQMVEHLLRGCSVSPPSDWGSR